jgi:glycosyltransferase involved in cell wall biosynthesis
MRHLRPDLMLVPNGLDLARYRFREPQSPLRHLVWLRAFHEIYNPVMAIEVLGRVRKEHPDVHLTMIGPDKSDGSLKKAKDAARKLGVEKAVAFLGAIPKQEVPSHLAQADIFLNTTNFDNTPVSVLEAMASGLPLVSTDVGGIPYLLQENETALLVPAGNVEAMTQAVARLIEEQSLAQRLALASYHKASGFDWKVVLPQWEHLLLPFLPGQHPMIQVPKFG